MKRNNGGWRPRMWPNARSDTPAEAGLTLGKHAAQRHQSAARVCQSANASSGTSCLRPQVWPRLGWKLPWRLECSNAFDASSQRAAVLLLTSSSFAPKRV